MKKALSLLLCLIMILTSFCACASEDSELPNRSEDSEYDWSKDLEYEIKKAYAKEHGIISDESEFNIDDVPMAYFGRYSGYEAVLSTGLTSPIDLSVEAGGHLFHFGCSNIILLYKNGKFIEFQTAFKQGKITQEDIDKLYEVFITSKNSN